jgi:HEAT repeat protein
VYSYFAGYQVRPLAIASLLAIGKDNPKLRKALVPALLAGINDRDVRTTLGAIRVLGEFGPGAKEAVPALKKAKLNPTQQIREAATAAIARIEKEDK